MFLLFGRPRTTFVAFDTPPSAGKNLYVADPSHAEHGSPRSVKLELARQSANERKWDCAPRDMSVVPFCPTSNMAGRKSRIAGQSMGEREGDCAPRDMSVVPICQLPTWRSKNLELPANQQTSAKGTVRRGRAKGERLFPIGQLPTWRSKISNCGPIGRRAQRGLCAKGPGEGGVGGAAVPPARKRRRLVDQLLPPVAERSRKIARLGSSLPLVIFFPCTGLKVR
ncbi:uncharacterized protein J3D65DRAFT_263698 [Phyllosticta citribraziliensis]|uniref:Uncharacterized protein n=1 Tax=Phyllosticta citribraziliensis TaxID=989973 RepID=A0ABR1M2F8_9PEZI